MCAPRASCITLERGTPGGPLSPIYSNAYIHLLWNQHEAQEAGRIEDIIGVWHIEYLIMHAASVCVHHPSSLLPLINELNPTAHTHISIRCTRRAYRSSQGAVQDALLTIRSLRALVGWSVGQCLCYRQPDSVDQGYRVDYLWQVLPGPPPGNLNKVSGVLCAVSILDWTTIEQYIRACP